MFKKANKDAASRSFDTVINKPVFRVVEAYKTLRTNILFSVPKEEGKARKILFTSSNPGEGKSTVSVNTAITFSQADMKVVLVDADLRKPTTHKFFKISSKCGLSNFLSGQNKLEECIQKINGVDNLDVITSGPLPPNPSELLSGKYMELLIRELEKNYDVIIIDTPPVNVVADALSASKLADGVIIVVSNNKTDKQELQNVVKSLEFAEAKILGIAFNRAKQYFSRKNRVYRNYYRHTEE